MKIQQFERLILDELRSKLASAGCAIIDLSTTSDATRRWNGALRTHPSLIPRCEAPEQVSQALRLVREAEQPVTIHDGGQDWTGRLFREGSVVLDLSAMNTISIDAMRRCAKR